jgi:hypothetical protein
MTGEVTLRGRVLPIGGLKEKLLAALRGGIKLVLIPAENEKDLVEIPANIREGLEIVPVAHVDEVLRLALVTAVVPIEWTAAERARHRFFPGRTAGNGGCHGVFQPATDLQRSSNRFASGTAHFRRNARFLLTPSRHLRLDGLSAVAASPL